MTPMSCETSQIHSCKTLLCGNNLKLQKCEIYSRYIQKLQAKVWIWISVLAISMLFPCSSSQVFCFCTHNWWLICAESCYHMHKSKHFLPMEMEQLILSLTHFPLPSCPLVPFIVSQSILFISYFTSQLHLSTLSLSPSISLCLSLRNSSQGVLIYPNN